MAGRRSLQVPLLSKHFRCVALDLPGHGQAPAPTGPISEADLVAAVQDYVEREGVRGEAGSQWGIMCPSPTKQGALQGDWGRGYLSSTWSGVVVWSVGVVPSGEEEEILSWTSRGGRRMRPPRVWGFHLHLTCPPALPYTHTRRRLLHGSQPGRHIGGLA